MNYTNYFYRHTPTNTYNLARTELRGTVVIIKLVYTIIMNYQKTKRSIKQQITKKGILVVFIFVMSLKTSSFWWKKMHFFSWCWILITKINHINFIIPSVTCTIKTNRITSYMLKSIKTFRLCQKNCQIHTHIHTIEKHYPPSAVK